MSGAPARASLDPADEGRFRDALRSLPAGQGRSLRVLRVAIAGWCRLVGWRLDITLAPQPEREGAPGAGCLVVAAPHRAWVDPFLLLAAWPRDAARPVWLADGRTATRSWWRRRVLPRLGVIPISGSLSGPRAYAELAAEVLAAGHAVVIFPEVGPPSAPDRLRRLSPGFAYLALRSGASLVPVVIAGTHRIVRGSTFSVDVLDRIDAGPAMIDPFTAEGRARSHELTDRYRGAITALLPGRSAKADARAPERDRWAWLANLFG